MASFVRFADPAPSSSRSALAIVEPVEEASVISSSVNGTNAFDGEIRGTRSAQGTAATSVDACSTCSANSSGDGVRLKPGHLVPKPVGLRKGCLTKPRSLKIEVGAVPYVWHKPKLDAAKETHATHGNPDGGRHFPTSEQQLPLPPTPHVPPQPKAPGGYRPMHFAMLPGWHYDDVEIVQGEVPDHFDVGSGDPSMECDLCKFAHMGVAFQQSMYQGLRDDPGGIDMCADCRALMEPTTQEPAQPVLLQAHEHAAQQATAATEAATEGSSAFLAPLTPLAPPEGFPHPTADTSAGASTDTVALTGSLEDARTWGRHVLKSLLDPQGPMQVLAPATSSEDFEDPGEDGGSVPPDLHSDATPGAGTRARSRSRSSNETVEEHSGIAAFFRDSQDFEGQPAQPEPTQVANRRTVSGVL